MDTRRLKISFEVVVGVVEDVSDAANAAEVIWNDGNTNVEETVPAKADDARVAIDLLRSNGVEQLKPIPKEVGVGDDE